MTTHRANGSKDNIEVVVDGKSDDAKAPLAPKLEVEDLIPVLSGNMKMCIGIVAFIAVILTMYVARGIKTNDFNLDATPFSSAQTSVCFGIMFVFTWYFGFVTMTAYNCISKAEDWHTASRRYLAEEGQVHLAAAFEFAGVLMGFYLCDRTNLLIRGKKKLDVDLFWFMWLVLMLGGLCTLRKAKPEKDQLVTKEDGTVVAPDLYHVKLLQRDQTEEWKGWMQIMFLWYHYFDYKGLYNLVRCEIAAYVWMTGFGNFSYYYIRKDFSFPRFCQMQWRLNFFVIFACAALSNEYMLYYICMLHTTFTLFIYFGLGIANHINATLQGTIIKFAALTVISLCIWDIDGMFDIVWYPVKWLVEFHDPNAQGARKLDTMHEWRFRSKLDHLVWIFGMFCAYNHPRADAFLVKLDNMPRVQGNICKVSIAAVAAGVLYWWADNLLSLKKVEYNAQHPFTSWIPILCYMILRNISQRLRMYHMELFAWCGKITLETYIAQFHIWMLTTGVNGSPKRLLVIIDNYPLVNFFVVSFLYMFISYRIFHLTTTLKTFVLPNKVTNAHLRRNLILTGAVVFGLYFASTLLNGIL